MKQRRRWSKSAFSPYSVGVSSLRIFLESCMLMMRARTLALIGQRLGAFTPLRRAASPIGTPFVISLGPPVARACGGITRKRSVSTILRQPVLEFKLGFLRVEMAG